MKEGLTYSSAGVNIEIGDEISKIFYDASKQTWKNRKGKLGEVIIPFDDFSGIRAINVSELPKGTLMNIGFDGVGTKIELAERVNNHKTIAYDLFAMVCDDAVVRGGEPVLVGSIFDVNSLEKDENAIEKVKQLAESYIDAAREANVVVINGEVAELGNRVSGFGNFNYNWGAGVVWFAKEERMFTGKKIKKGDSIIGLREEGFRANGLSLVRKIMQNVYGNEWHNLQWKRRRKTFGELILTPSKIYTRTIVNMFGGYDKNPRAEIHGVAHITGGGLPGKLKRVLKPSGLGAIIFSPFEPPEVMEYVQYCGKVKDEEAYKTWNMGQGMVVITNEPDKVMDIAFKNKIESKLIGEIFEKPEIRVFNRGSFSPDKFRYTANRFYSDLKGPRNLVYPTSYQN